MTVGIGGARLACIWDRFDRSLSRIDSIALESHRHRLVDSRAEAGSISLLHNSQRSTRHDMKKERACVPAQTRAQDIRWRGVLNTSTLSSIFISHFHPQSTTI